MTSPENSPAPAQPLAVAEKVLGDVAERHVALTRAFLDAGHTLYLVGGPVRDALLGHVNHDLDFTTDATPDVVQPIMEAYADVVWTAGIEFGTISGEKDGEQLEITTFRADAYDRVSRNPVVRFGDTLEDDLVRRDFRVNAMAARLGVDADGHGTVEVLDPLGGLSDLAAGVLDTPGTPEDSFNDDPLRMLRAARFVSQLGFTVAPRVQQAMTEMAGQLERITVERINQEFTKLMLGTDPATGIDLLVQTGLCEQFLPEVPALQLEPDEHLQHKDVYAHSLKVLQQACDLEEDEPDLVLRLAALLHDIGKPATRAAKPGGGVTFHQHEVVGAKLARQRLKALRYPKEVIKNVNDLVFLHMRFYGYADGAWTDSAVRRYVTDAGSQLDRLNKIVRADCTTRNQRKAARLRRAYDNLEDRIAEIAEKEDLAKVRPDLDGGDIMRILGLSPGPTVGKAWTYMKDLRLENGPMSPEDAEAALLAWWADNKPADDS
ncbi:CCA tRNA nucleotidyltransferase [Corynebacterium sp. 13CS0277]|uniref:CCA tRNA nucleotidyltransferase n=1 Tax=Corynebacterium sp. 13CS0277 TaxID=2071994 RepID=UPI000D04313E|nr:CCA tRNA nucleotidyltransferase [Corynebacterium sp. 13CS0277]PRQ11085.1 CCA tRNA nucleotidyltransferase [Corynebacterium sp. 13CS0277]